MSKIEKNDILENLSIEDKVKAFLIFKAPILALFAIGVMIKSVEFFLISFVIYLVIFSYLKNLYNQNPSKFPKYFAILNEENKRQNVSFHRNTNDYYERTHLITGSSSYRR